MLSDKECLLNVLGKGFTGRSLMADAMNLGGLGAGASAEDREMIGMLATERKRAELQAAVMKITDLCWDKCMGKPGSKLDYKTEKCFQNCTARFIETSQQAAQSLVKSYEKQQSSGGMF